ncbi:hypothetical protein L1887_22533 [Cichorium endivia]|nr:hypothetical protein L1887_22533 [Cichorium endivia]
MTTKDASCPSFFLPSFNQHLLAAPTSDIVASSTEAPHHVNCTEHSRVQALYGMLVINTQKAKIGVNSNNKQNTKLALGIS